MDKVFLISKVAKRRAPVPRFLTKDEMATLGYVRRGFSVVLKLDVVTPVDYKIGKRMMEKYPGDVIMVDKTMTPINDLAKMTRTNLLKYANMHKIENIADLSAEELVEVILKAQHAGVMPMTEEEYGPWRKRKHDESMAKARAAYNERKKDRVEEPEPELPPEFIFDKLGFVEQLDSEDKDKAKQAAFELAYHCEVYELKRYDWRKIAILMDVKPTRETGPMFKGCKAEAEQIFSEGQVGDKYAVL